MKVIVASFQCEGNSFTTIPPQESDFEYFKGQDIFKKLVVDKYLKENDIEIIPSIYANALPTGVVPLTLYNKYKEEILQTVRDNSDADGIYVYVHGSMDVEKIGSGELFLFKEIRKITSDKPIIAISMDLHANITPDLNKYVDIICTYKTAPHTDQVDTQIRAIKGLIYCLKKNLRPCTTIIKVPMLIKGDTMLTKIEPLKSLETETLQYEKNKDLLGVNLFFGHCWIDQPYTSASVVVSGVNKEQNENVAKYFANKFWNTRKDYKFTIEADNISNCVRFAIKAPENRVFLTDSGDNTTAGAEGDKLYIAKEILKYNTDKKICIAGITDSDIINKYYNLPDNAQVDLEKLNIKGTILAHGEILGWAKEIIGRALVIRYKTIDFIFTEKRSAFIEKGNFDKAHVNLKEYNIVVVKLGYLFSELKPYADREIFVLSDGSSCVEVEKLGLKNIARPLYPLDIFDWNV